jgi:type III secretory pathway component EscS
MSDAAAFTILALVALVLGWPWWAIVAASVLAVLLAVVDARTQR